MTKIGLVRLFPRQWPKIGTAKYLYFVSPTLTKKKNDHIKALNQYESILFVKPFIWKRGRYLAYERLAHTQTRPRVPTSMDTKPKVQE